MSQTNTCYGKHNSRYDKHRREEYDSCKFGNEDAGDVDELEQENGDLAVNYRSKMSVDISWVSKRIK